ncbi:MAG: triose-phosphate isomerase [Thiohalomonadaceae bacterium]
MRRPLVAGNWKMNGSKASIETLLGGIKAGIAGVEKAEVAVCPPFVYIPQVAEALRGTRIALGAQNVSNEPSGAFTGEVSAAMLKDMGCEYVIVGHSERRSYYGEGDLLVAKKFAAVRAAGMKPILCVGETLEERERNVTEAVVARQLEAVIELEGAAALQDGVIAYEPVWAIGTGRTATPQQAQDVHAFIRGRIAAVDGAVAQKVRILYGGSVKGSNAEELFGQPDIDGGLIGGASLNADEFLAICKAAR